MGKVKKKPSLTRGLAVSGGADSVYLFFRCGKGDVDDQGVSGIRNGFVLLHMNHRTRGKESDEDQRFVEELAKQAKVPLVLGKMRTRRSASGGGENFEARARSARYSFFRRQRDKLGIRELLLGHTADDQVETVLMRILAGAGISGLKGIPRTTADGVVRPLLDTWREDILRDLKARGIRFRVDKSNFDTRYERNWIRHVLLPLLEKRYGKAVRARVFALGERFREIDEFLEATVRRWMKRHVKPGPDGGASTFRVPRAPYGKLPSVVRKKIVQVLCFEGMKTAPNERLIESMDKVIMHGKSSARLSLGKGASLSCRYGEAVFRSRAAGDASGARRAGIERLVVRNMEGKPTPARLRRLADGEREAAFDADDISGPFAVRPLRAGDRIRPFGLDGEKKVKQILIDRKVPRDERWGRPVVCDASGEIVWIPGVVRSAIAPVARDTRRTIVLGFRRPSTT